MPDDDDKTPDPENKPDDKPDDDKKPQAGNVDDLPQWARDEITKANREAAGYRTKVRELEPLAQKAKELEDASKSETQKLSDERDGHKSRADTAEAEAMRLRIAIDKAPEGASLARVRAVAKRIVGTSREELEADAEEMFAEYAGDTGSEKDRPKQRPKDKLRDRTVSSDGDAEVDVQKVIDAIPRQ